jgi:hypothetical protein
VHAHADPNAALVRTKVTLEAQSMAIIRPADWSAAALATTKLAVTVHDQNGKVVRQEQI